ncbi:hypothetical protein Krac_1130 [Ktedonobacter racemifer DSM 44963]|uniref:Uncharacterized protein n=1 Tax=Ktedonobacter racemifer DSM 44963 TaxID=485913 RepID=D6U6A9_KTERA|nr:hypothetical protein Krac_1130 [Ktedonobacter racemifer DSM 44963]
MSGKDDVNVLFVKKNVHPAPHDALTIFSPKNIFASNVFTILFDKSKFTLHFLPVWMGKVASIPIMCHKFQRHLFTFSANKQRNMRLLNSFWLIDSTTYLIFFPFKECLILCPHRLDDLERFFKLK